MQFLADYFPLILFFLAFKLQGIFVATAVAIAASVVQIAYFRWRRGNRWCRQRCDNQGGAGKRTNPRGDVHGALPARLFIGLVNHGGRTNQARNRGRLYT